ncbi:MAG: hypothetical protein A3I76_07205 [Elusimicrobia bacterium RIFCSPLOWO2_02_FULL_61_11]|nr:MAG: hypothetical protein A3I76_07205 [Elusimicrobia bacterium RIFCSPLOWO2_02_FULL_61_11]
MTYMKNLKQAAGYFWAAAAFLAALAAMSSHEDLGRGIAATGLTISPVFSGGEIARTLDRKGYAVFLHRPVFDALLREKREGFVQVDWGPYEALPARLTESLDLDGDGREETVIELEKAVPSVLLRTADCRVGPAEKPLIVEKARAVRLYQEPAPPEGPADMKKIAVRVALRKNCVPAKGRAGASHGII